MEEPPHTFGARLEILRLFLEHKIWTL